MALERGERGPKGDHGQEGHSGATGPTGATGKQGVQGDAGEDNWRSKAFKILWTVWITAFSVIVIWAIHSNRSLINKVDRSTVQVAQLEKTQAQLRRAQQDSCTNFIVLRDAVNEFHSSFDRVLETAQKAREAAYNRTRNSSDLKAAKAFKKLRSGIHTVHKSCAQNHK